MKQINSIHFNALLHQPNMGLSLIWKGFMTKFSDTV